MSEDAHKIVKTFMYYGVSTVSRIFKIFGKQSFCCLFWLKNRCIIRQIEPQQYSMKCSNTLPVLNKKCNTHMKHGGSGVNFFFISV